MPNLALRMDNSEKSLLMEVAAGNENAFKQLFNLYHSQLRIYIYRITNSYELTDEIVQDAFLKVWINHAALGEIQSFKAYLFVLTKNHTLNYLRKLTKEQKLRNGWEEDYMKTPEVMPDNLYYRLLDEAIDQLSPQQQKVYLLSRHQRLKYTEIADELKLSRETVKSYLKIATASIATYVKARLKLIASLLLSVLVIY